MDNVNIATPEKVIETIIASEKYLEKSKENNTMLSVVDYILDYNNNLTKSYSIPTIDMLVLLAEKTDLLNIMQQKGISKVWSCTPASSVGWIWAMDKYGQTDPRHYTEQLVVIPITWEWVSE
jgi:hypothetical protein